MTQATTTPTDMVERWLAIYGASDADAAALLVDGHDPEAIAFTVIEVEPESARVKLSCEGFVGETMIMDGVAVVRVPRRRKPSQR